MSNITLSTLNKYVLSKSGRLGSGQLYVFDNITFPNDFVNLQTDFGSLTQQDTIINFQPELQNVWWKDLTPYKIESSSYGIFDNNIFEMPQFMFDDSNSTFWAPCESHSTFGNTFNRDGVNQGQYSQYPYEFSGVYRGGGNASYYYQVTTQQGHTIVGEYVDITFPYKIILNELSIMARPNAPQRAPKNIAIVGSDDDGLTWNTIIEDLEFNNAYSNNIFQNKTIPIATTAYDKIKIIFISVKSDVNLNVGGIKFNFDAHAILP